MPLEIRGGDVISVPCRSCGKQFLKFRVEEVTVQIACSKCGRSTQIAARKEREEWRIFTAPVAEITNRNSH